jgi:UDPglucose 6-dehydrogenase
MIQIHIKQRPYFSYMTEPLAFTFIWYVSCVERSLQTIDNIYNHAANKTCFELCISVSDGLEFDSIVQKCTSLNVPCKISKCSYNELCTQATGSYLVLWDDTCGFEDPGWDISLMKHTVTKPYNVWFFKEQLPVLLRTDYALEIGHLSLYTPEPSMEHVNEWLKKVFADLLQFASTDDILHLQSVRSVENVATKWNQEESLKTIYIPLYIRDANRILSAFFPEKPRLLSPSTGDKKMIGVFCAEERDIAIAAGFMSYGHFVYCVGGNPSMCTTEKDVVGTSSIRPLIEKLPLRFIDVATVVDVCDTIIVNGDIDTRIISIAEHLKKNRCVTFVVTSTSALSATAQLAERLQVHGAKVCYNPLFIEKGTTLRDLMYPEFIVLGVDDPKVGTELMDMYKTISSAPVIVTTFENAEIIKMSYDNFVATKQTFANTVLGICDRTPNSHADVVMRVLKLGTQRITSGAFLDTGMELAGDYVTTLAASANKAPLFENVATNRELNIEYLVNIVERYYEKYMYHIYIIGTAIAPQTNRETNSAALLLYDRLLRRNLPCETYDPYVCGEPLQINESIIVIGTKHEAFERVVFPDGCVIIDPFRYITYRHTYTALHRVGDISGSVNRIKM